IPASIAAELICSAQINAWVLTADRKHLDLGFDAELATPDQKIALAIRDQTCRWKRCTREASRSEAHHLKHREHAGCTDLNNLALLCPYHHDRLHQLKLHLKMGKTADHWQLKDIHGQTVDQWTKPTPPWANPSPERGRPKQSAAAARN
ncbi:MAG: HNH endonuclease, partial [Actinomycetia bacterium]|nr:HNH endonuclease [Actinomycetes bacterium]